MRGKGSFLYFVLALFITLLLDDNYLKIGIGLIGAVFVITLVRNPMLYRTSLLHVFMAVAGLTLLCILMGLMPGFSDILDRSVAVKELYRVVIYIVIMETLLLMEINIKVYAAIWRILLFFIVGIAILQFTKVIDIDTILKDIYGNSVQFFNSQSEDIETFRCGSVFINPNVFACFLAAELAGYFFILQHMEENLLLKIVTFGLIITGFVLAGSRTGMVSGTAVVLAYMFVSSRDKGKSFFWELCMLIIGIAGILLIAVYAFHTDLLSFPALRIFQIDEGRGNSLSIKLNNLTALLSDMSGVNRIVGYGPFDYTKKSSLLVDFDFGYFITYFGMCGAIVYFFLLKAIYTWGDRELYGRRFLNMMFLFTAILFGITSGVYFNLRIFSIYLLLFLPELYLDGEQIA